MTPAAPSPDGPLIGVLALQGDVREHQDVLAECGARSLRVRSADQLVDVDALVIPGGESTTMSKLAVSLDLMEPLRHRVKEGMPVYGSCAGMIMLADRLEGGRPDQQTIGGIDMLVRRNAFGRQVDSFEADLAMPALGSDPVRGVFIRAPWVESVGDAVTVLGRVESGPATGRIVAVRQGDLVATSFHPELTGDTRVHRYFVELVRQSLSG
ncbi:MAG TPA: pyridoxal 5'-phosphate synthase glutaminase subunit PdxT [Actinomycetes bacterium]|nr:pyridoxal 5'-phosphate synthase glutaminase subunit PdxT [Actinomycetes bacterium]